MERRYVCSGSGMWGFTERRGSLAVCAIFNFSPSRGQNSRFFCCRLCLQLQSCAGKCLLVKVLLCFHVV